MTAADIERYQGGHLAAVPSSAPVSVIAPAADTDSWVKVVHEIATLAAEIAHTDFVPRSMQGKPAAVTAAILAGREMGVGPMTALQHIHIIQGRPGQSAHLMRALVLAAGHQVDYLEVSDSRAIVRGRRRGEQEWTEVTFTADQARKAKIDLGGYPEDKLIARATARLCRRKFADVISGLAYTVEELQDGDIGFGEDITPAPAIEAPAEQSAPKPAGRTAQRRTATRKATQVRPAAEPADPEPERSGPPLPGEDETESDTEDDRSADLPGTITKAQSSKLHAVFNDAQITERAHKIRLASQIVNRELDSSSDLSKHEASTLIDTLEELHRDGALVEVVAGYVQQDSSDG